MDAIIIKIIITDRTAKTISWPTAL